MKTAIVALLLFATVPGVAQSARDYYNELYTAGGLDRMADVNVCFSESPEDSFFIFAKSDAMRQFLIDNGGYKKLTKKQQANLDKGFLTARIYNKGVPAAQENYYEKDQDTWVDDPVTVQGHKMRMRLAMEWSTMRYRQTVELLNPNGTFKSVIVTRYGRCEVIKPDVKQNGGEP